MRNNYTGGIASFTAGMILLALLSFMVLRWLDMPVGSFVDWLIGIGIFAWLMTIVTVPWNIHFEAKEVLNEAKTSQELAIKFDEKQLVYVKRLASASLIIALFLHIISTIGLYWLAVAQISVVGYIGSGAAALLTFLRPAIRLYEYISMRLATIRQSITYPREDVYLLKTKVESLEYNFDWLMKELDENSEDSWRTHKNKEAQQLKTLLEKLKFRVEELDKHNEKEHERIAKETRHAVAQLSEDGKFIDNIIEIIRFIKKV